jgi:hypothetical protein
MTLVHRYKAAGRRTVDHGRSPAERQLRQTRVLKFLDWCDIRGVMSFGGIQQQHYAGFVRQLQTEGLAERTIYRYRLALREFFRRWKVKIKVAVPRQKRADAWRSEVQKALDRIPDLNTALRDRIMTEMEKGNNE